MIHFHNIMAVNKIFIGALYVLFRFMLHVAIIFQCSRNCFHFSVSCWRPIWHFPCCSQFPSKLPFFVCFNLELRFSSEQNVDKFDLSCPWPFELTWQVWRLSSCHWRLKTSSLELRLSSSYRSFVALCSELRWQFRITMTGKVTRRESLAVILPLLSCNEGLFHCLNCLSFL